MVNKSPNYFSKTSLGDAPNNHSLLTFNQVACHRDERVLFSGVNYTINSGDIVQITGANGIGKTTLLRAIIGLLQDYEGDIRWRGQSLDGRAIDKNSDNDIDKDADNYRYDFTSELLFIGHLAGVKQSLTPRENLQFLANLHGTTAYSLGQVDDALAQVGLYGYEDMPGHQLSAGQNRRIALARLYLNQATIWVLDEPYTALDAQAIKKLEALFVTHAEQGGCVVFTSHQAPAIQTLRILSLSDYVDDHKGNLDG
jgi:heme exporter protein A